MMLFLAVLFACIFVSPVFAQPAKASRHGTIKDLVALTLRSGSTTYFAIDFGEDLGFASEMPAKRIWYQSKGVEHLFYVVYPSSDTERREPSALVWQKVISKKVQKGMKYDAKSFRSSLSGVLENAAEGGGQGEGVWHEARPVPQFENEFRKEVDFFLKAAVPLKLQK